MAKKKLKVKVISVEYERRFNTAKYEHEEYRVTGAVDDGQDPIEVIQELRSLVKQAHEGEIEVGEELDESEEADEEVEEPKKRKAKKQKPEADEEDDSEEEIEEDTADEVDEEETKPKKKSGKKTKASAYSRNDDLHKKLMVELLDKVEKGYVAKNISAAKDISLEMHNKDFLDKDGEILPEFSKRVRILAKKLKQMLLLKPKETQLKARKFAIEHPYSILAMDPGMGKTLTALITWMEAGGRLLIVCPAFLVLNWKYEIKKTLGDEPIVTVIQTGKEIYNIFDTDIAIISYDLAQKAEYFFEWADVAVFDEGQNLKSMKAKRTQFIHKAVYENSIPKVYILTGTPIKNRVEEFYSLLAICYYRPEENKSDFLERFPDSITFADYFSFRHQYNYEYRPGRFIPIVKWTGFRNLKELRKYLAPIYLRMKSDLKLGLYFKDIIVSEKKNDALWKAFQAFVNDEDKQGTGPTVKAEAALATAPFTVRYTKALLEDSECVVILTDHIESCKLIAQKFDTVPIYQGTSMPARQRLVERFQAGEMKAIVGTYGTLGEGRTLTRAFNEVLNDPPWVPGTLKQAYHRIHRESQTKNCWVHRMLGTPQCEKIYEALYDKQQTIEAVT